jgi:hypothetical protein
MWGKLAMSNGLAMTEKFITYVERVSQDETNVEQIGDEGQVCNLCEQFSEGGTGHILD